MKLAYAVFLFAAAGFFALTILPLTIAPPQQAWASDFSNGVFAPFCHQLPERSITVAGATMPVCSRCFGIYLGMFLGALIYPRISSGKTPKGWVIFAAAAPLVIDGLTQLTGLRTSSNGLRMATGLLFGYVIPFYMIPILNDVLGGREIFKRRGR